MNVKSNRRYLLAQTFDLKKKYDIESTSISYQTPLALEDSSNNSYNILQKHHSNPDIFNFERKNSNSFNRGNITCRQYPTNAWDQVNQNKQKNLLQNIKEISLNKYNPQVTQTAQKLKQILQSNGQIVNKSNYSCDQDREEQASSLFKKQDETFNLIKHIQRQTNNQFTLEKIEELFQKQIEKEKQNKSRQRQTQRMGLKQIQDQYIYNIPDFFKLIFFENFASIEEFLQQFSQNLNFLRSFDQKPSKSIKKILGYSEQIKNILLQNNSFYQDLSQDGLIRNCIQNGLIKLNPRKQKNIEDPIKQLFNSYSYIDWNFFEKFYYFNINFQEQISIMYQQQLKEENQNFQIQLKNLKYNTEELNLKKQSNQILYLESLKQNIQKFKQNQKLKQSTIEQIEFHEYQQSYPYKQIEFTTRTKDKQLVLLENVQYKQH